MPRSIAQKIAALTAPNTISVSGAATIRGSCGRNQKPGSNARLAWSVS